jgi:hypothetical protein
MLTVSNEETVLFYSSFSVNPRWELACRTMLVRSPVSDEATTAIPEVVNFAQTSESREIKKVESPQSGSCEPQSMGYEGEGEI